MFNLTNSWSEKKKKKRHRSFLIKIFKKLSLFTGKAKRFTEPVGETKHKPAIA